MDDPSTMPFSFQDCTEFLDTLDGPGYSRNFVFKGETPIKSEPFWPHTDSGYVTSIFESAIPDGPFSTPNHKKQQATPDTDNPNIGQIHETVTSDHNAMRTSPWQRMSPESSLSPSAVQESSLDGRSSVSSISSKQGPSYSNIGNSLTGNGSREQFETDQLSPASTLHTTFASSHQSVMLVDGNYDTTGFLCLSPGLSAVEKSSMPLPSEPCSPLDDYLLTTSDNDFLGWSHDSKYDTRQLKSNCAVSNKTGKLSNCGKTNKVKKEKTSHNMIEKRYRNNINNKFLALRNCVPALRCVAGDTAIPTEDLEGLDPAKRLNKATVLSKAIEYISHLERRNRFLTAQLEGKRQNQFDHPDPKQEQVQDSHNAFVSHNCVQPEPSTNKPSASSFATRESKILMCSMAGVMGASALANSSTEFHELMATPVFTSFLPSGFSTLSIINVAQLSLLLGFLWYALIPLTLPLGRWPDQKSLSNQEKLTEQAFQLSANSEKFTSAAELRQRTWQVHSSIANVPSGNNSSLWLSICTTFRLLVASCAKQGSITKQVGSIWRLDPSWNSSFLRAMDAFLCGGDRNASTSQLVLFFLKSFLLPATPRRYLNEAISVSILAHSFKSRYSRIIGHLLSRVLLNCCRTSLTTNKTGQVDEALSKHAIALLSVTDALEDPEIVQRMFNLTFKKPVNMGCTSGLRDEDTQSIERDFAVKSAIDALAAWNTCRLLPDIIVLYLETGKVNDEALELCSKIAPANSIVQRRVAALSALLRGSGNLKVLKNCMMTLGFDIAETPGAAQSGSWNSSKVIKGRVKRQTSKRAAYKRKRSVKMSLQLGCVTDIESEDPLRDDECFSSEGDSTCSSMSDTSTEFITKSTPSFSSVSPISLECKLALYSALIRAYLNAGKKSEALRLLERMTGDFEGSDLGLLGFVAVWGLLEKHNSLSGSTTARARLDKMAAAARVWVGSCDGEVQRLSLTCRKNLVNQSVKLCVHFCGLGSLDLSSLDSL